MIGSLFLPKWQARYESLPLLGGLWSGFCDWLHQQGYDTDAIRRRVQGGPLLEEALQSRGVLSLKKLTASDLHSFAPLPTRWTELLACSLVRSLTEYLVERGELASTPLTSIDLRVAAFCRFLERVRGLAPSTAARNGHTIAQFLRFLSYDANPHKLRELNIRDVDAFIAQIGHSLGRASMQKVTAIMRSFLRFLAAEGEGPVGLDELVDSPRCFRGERLPRALPWSSVRSLLLAINRATPIGRRDYAMLLLIATYGLRVGEIAALRLDDFSWRSRQIQVPRPKVGTPLLLPLTDEVAVALLDYLRHGRAPSAHRHVFLKVRTPGGPIKSTVVCDTFDAWATRAGIKLPPKGAGGPHCLRHSLAVHLLRQGASIAAIGDLLGHRSAESTSVYLRLQVEDLRDVALPLPGAIGPQVQP